MQRFKSSDQAQDFLSTHAIIYGHFRPRRHRLSAAGYRRARTKAFRIWQQETSVQLVGGVRHTDGSSVNSSRPQLTWQCLFRYLLCRSREKRHRLPARFSSATAFG